ncbi:MAG: hypothetical protein Q9218_005767 [Villophora microphyllina]
MFPVLVGLLTITSPCFARPAQDGPANQPLNLTGPSRGFPTEYLPINILPSVNDTVNLKIPINPADHLASRPVVTLFPGLVPKGVDLVASIAIRICGSWADTANLKIRGKIEDRRLPFKDFEFITQPSPSPRTVLTSLKTGLALCWMLRDSLTAQGWFGKIHASIWDANPQTGRRTVTVGQIDITNSPLRGSTSLPVESNGTSTSPSATEILQLSNDTTPSPERTGSGGSVSSAVGVSRGIPLQYEKRWLMCWSAFLFFALTHHSAEFVRDALGHRRPSFETVNINFPCDFVTGQPTRDQLVLTVYSDKVTGGRELVYGTLIPAILGWITNVAETINGWASGRAIIDKGQLVSYGTMAVHLDYGSHEAAATA